MNIIDKRNRKSISGVRKVCKDSKDLMRGDRKARILFNVVQNRVFCVDAADTQIVDNINVIDCGIIDRYISMDAVRLLVAQKVTQAKN